jgi:hypothetical protein
MRWGGAIRNFGEARVSNSTFENNSAEAGGAIANFSNHGAILMIDSSTFSFNEAQGAGSLGTTNIDWGGGAIFNGPEDMDSYDQGSGSVEIYQSNFNDNHAYGRGGAIANLEGEIVIVESEFLGNFTQPSGYGGAVYNEDLMTIGRSTLALNHAETGGGAFNYGGYLTFSNSTIASNNAMSAGGISSGINMLAAQAGRDTYNGVLILHSSTITNNQHGVGLHVGLSQRTEIRNTIVADNEWEDCDFSSSANLDLRDFTIDSDGTCTGFSLTADPRFGGLGENGGPTRTVSLLAGSPAIDAALGPCLATDQRGEARPIGAACDVGAYEAPFLVTLIRPDLIFTLDPGVCLGYSEEGIPEISHATAGELGFLTGRGEEGPLREVTWVPDGRQCCASAELLKPILDTAASEVVGALGSIPFAGGALAAVQARLVSSSELGEMLWTAMQETLEDKGPEDGQPLEGFPEDWINPLPPCPASGTWAYVDRETNCRTGPGLDYPNKGAIRVGEFTEVVGRHEEWDFWYVKDVRVPNSYCWIWGEYAHILGDSDKLSVVIPDPPPIEPSDGDGDGDGDGGPTCTGSEKTPEQCKSVGGTWIFPPVGVEYCKCK